MLWFLDATIGKWVRHFLFVLVRVYFALFFNVSCSNKHLLQGAPGTLVLATHVSRHDGPLIAAVLYPTARIRPTVHYSEYYSIAQWFPMFVSGAIPMSSPKTWPDEKRKARKDETLDIIRKVLGNDNPILIFPAGRVRRQPEEMVAPYLSGVRDILRTAPGTPVLLMRIDGLGQFQTARHDGFWSFIGRAKGRRHVNMDLRRVEGLDPEQDLESFNAQIADLLNTPISETL